MELNDLYNRFNNIQAARLGRLYRVSNPYQVPAISVVRIWAGIYKEYYADPAGASLRDSEILLGMVANLILEWEAGGKRAAILWKIKHDESYHGQRSSRKSI